MARHRPTDYRVPIDGNVAGRSAVSPSAPPLQRGVMKPRPLGSVSNDPRTAPRCLAADSGACLRRYRGIRARARAAFGAEGTLPHRTFGWIWVALMLVVCISSFF